MLLTNGILRLGELADQPEELFTTEFVGVIPQSVLPLTVLTITGNNVNTECFGPSYRWSLDLRIVL